MRVSVRLVTGNPLYRGMSVGLLCGLFCWWLNGSTVVRSLENQALDLCFLMRSSRPTKSRVILVGIDDRTLARIRKPLMYFSPEFAHVVRYLADQGVAAIGIDFLVEQSLSNSTELRPGGLGDPDLLGAAIGGFGKVVLPKMYEQADDSRQLVWTYPLQEWVPFSDNWSDLGYVNLNYADLVVRSQDLRIRSAVDAGVVDASFPLACFGASRGFDKAWLEAPSLNMDGRTVPVTPGTSDEALINFVGPAGTFPVASFWDVLHAADPATYADDQPRPLDFAWQDAIVLIGTMYANSPDQHPTPYSNLTIPPYLRSFSRVGEASLMHGVEIHANTIATLEDRAFITTPWWLSTPLWLLATGIAMGAVLSRISLEMGLAATFLHHWLWKLVCILGFAAGHYRIEMVSMLVLGTLVYGVVFALRWRWIRKMMGLVKSEAVARTLEADPRSLERIGDEREITVFFSDIRNFTTYSETRSAGEVVHLLNEYFAAIVPKFEAQGGILNQYMGDGVMVLFGAPEPQADHAVRAVQAALDAIQEVHRNCKLWENLGVPELRVGVGIHTGKAVVGTIGSPNRLDYTAIGDTVNTASRIESGNKELGTEILISESTFRAIPPDRRAAFSRDWTPRNLKVKGKTAELTVYALTPPGEKSALPPP